MTIDTPTTDTLQPMDLGDTYASTFSLMRRTPAITVFALLITFGASVLYGYGYMVYIGAQATVAAKGGLTPGADPAVAQEAARIMMEALVPFLFTVVIFMFVLTFTQVAITLAGWDAINNRPASLGRILAESVRRPFWMSLIQTLIFIVIMVMVALVTGILTFVLGGGDVAKISIIFALLFPIILTYPVIATIFRVHKVVIESRGPWQGMIASIALVKGRWWRTFGAIMLLGLGMIALQLIIGFAMGTMRLPGAAIGTSPTDAEAIATALRQAKEAYTWGYVIANGVCVAIATSFLFYLLTPLYVDLRARRGEFLPADQLDNEDAGPAYPVQ